MNETGRVGSLARRTRRLPSGGAHPPDALGAPRTRPTMIDLIREKPFKSEKIQANPA